MTPKKKTTGELIRAARLAKSKRIYDELIATGQRIGRGETATTMYLQGDLAKASGVTQAQVSSWECGRAEPLNDTLKKLAKALDVPWLTLLAE